MLGIDTSFGAKLCLTQGNDTNIWANRLGLVLNLHHLEYITWVSCDIGSLPASAMNFFNGNGKLPAAKTEAPDYVQEN